MEKAFCVKCKKMITIKNPTTKNLKGRSMIIGVCPVCNTKVARFLPSKGKRILVASMLQKAL